MSNKTSLHILTPCNEDWNKMTSTQQGKFCDACSKQVVDFSMMSDQQILHYLSQHAGKLCGRFNSDQLARPLIETKLSRKQSWWLAMALPFTLIFQKSFGQKQSPPKQDIQKDYKQMGRPTMGAPAIVISDKKPLKTITIKGKAEDEFGNAVAGVSIVVKGTTIGVATDSLGEFLLPVTTVNDSIKLTASYVGYGTIEKQINTNMNDTFVSFMFTQTAMLGDVIVMGYVSPKIEGKVGGVSVCRKMTTTEKIDSSLRRITKTNSFYVYPNPAVKGSLVYIKVKEAGSYELQLLDNNSRLLTTTNINVSVANTPVSFQLPVTVSAGIFYLRLINLKNKKTDLEKMVIN